MIIGGEGFEKNHTLQKWTMHSDVKFCLSNFKLNVKNVNINVDIQIINCTIT